MSNNDTTSEELDTTLRRRDFLSSDDNPHELIIVKCNKCLIRVDATREELQKAGWRVFVEDCMPSHEGFPVCPEHSNFEYTWEDLY